MLKRLYFCIIIICVLFIFSGCKDFFTFNLFDGLDYVAVPTTEQLSAKTPQESVDYLKEQFTSSSFMDTVAADPETADEIAAYLEQVYTDPTDTIDTPTQVSAAVLAADLELAVTGGDELIGNIWNAITEIQALGDTGGGGDESAAMQSILTGIVPEAVTTDQTAFTTLVTGVLNAGQIYQTLNTIITVDPVGGTSTNDITGGVVFNAAITVVVTEIVDTILLPEYKNTPEAAATVLWNLIKNPDPTAVDGINPSADMSTIFDDLLNSVGGIADAAGADLLSLFGQTMPA